MSAHPPPLAPATAWNDLPSKWLDVDVGPDGVWIAVDPTLAWLNSPLATVVAIGAAFAAGFATAQAMGLVGTTGFVIVLGALMLAQMMLWTVRRATGLHSGASRRREAEALWARAVADPSSAPPQALCSLALAQAVRSPREGGGGLCSRFMRSGFSAATLEARFAQVGLARPRTVVLSCALVPTAEDLAAGPIVSEPESLGGTGDRRGWRGAMIGGAYVVLGFAAIGVVGRVGWLLVGFGAILTLTGLLRATGVRPVEIQTTSVAPGRVATAGAVMTDEVTWRECVAVVRGTRDGLSAAFVDGSKARVAIAFGSPRDERYLRWWRAWHAPGEPALPITESLVAEAKAEPE